MASAGSMPVTWTPFASGANRGPLPHPTSKTRSAPTSTQIDRERNRSKRGPRPISRATGSLE